MVHQRQVSLHNHRGLAAVVPKYVYVRYEDLIKSDGGVNDAVLQKIGSALGLGELLTPPSLEAVPYFTYARPKMWWVPWRNFFGLSAMSMPEDRIRYRVEKQYMCAYQQIDLDLVNEILDAEEEEKAGYFLVHNASDYLHAGSAPLHELDAARVWQAVAARCK